jgi:uncharacterized protein
VSTAAPLKAIPAHRHPAVPYVLPFGVFLFFLVIQKHVPVSEAVEFPVRFFILVAVLWFVSRPVIDLRVRNFAASTVAGAAVFLLWVAPDVLWPGYREHWLFQNSLTGKLHSSIDAGSRMEPVVLLFRSLRAIIVVPIVEELFWRAWLMRWLIRPEFTTVPLGAYSAFAFWVTAALFASEHGPFWEVGLMAGAIYNWWMVRTKSLGDLIYAHALTNALLCGFVLVTKRWEFWL